MTSLKDFLKKMINYRESAPRKVAELPVIDINTNVKHVQKIKAVGEKKPLTTEEKTELKKRKEERRQKKKQIKKSKRINRR